MKINKLLFGMLLLLLASCGSSRKVEKQSDQVAVQEINLTPEQQRKYDYFFLEASRLKVKKEYTAAFDLLQHCLYHQSDRFGSSIRDCPVLSFP